MFGKGCRKIKPMKLLHIKRHTTHISNTGRILKEKMGQKSNS